MTNEREQRGMAIAALTRIEEKNGAWTVPSQTGEGRYTVDPSASTCTCPDFETRGGKCKHIFAVEFTIKRERNRDGTVTQTRTLTVTEQVTTPDRPTYKQDWPSYNYAQATEKRRLQVLLHDLCRNLPDEERAHRRGPKPHLTRDCVFSMAFKVYCGLSSRRFSCDLLEAHERGHITKPIPGVKVPAFFEDERFTPILTDLVAASAAPLAAVESDFAIDSTGFSSSRFYRWFDEKYGVTRQRATWIKAHVACGVRTHCITAIRALDRDSGDHGHFAPLMQETAKTFTVNECSADKAYTSNENYEAIASIGGTAFMPFKSNATGGVGGLFAKMLGYFTFRREDFLQHYHKRSNVESVFSAVKRKFGDSVMSRTDAAMRNEVLCKCLCQNLTCLIQEQETLGIAPVFWN